MTISAAGTGAGRDRTLVFSRPPGLRESRRDRRDRLGAGISYSYAYALHEIAAALEGVVRTSTISTQAADVVWSALRSHRTGVDFGDALLASINEHAGCEKTFTFDRKAAKPLADFPYLA